MDIYFKEKGNLKAPTIIFIHGGGMSGQMWDVHIKYFIQFHCIAIDLPEHGNSINVRPFSVSESARQIAQIIKSRANEGKAHVIGHSLGGIVLIELLSIYPTLVDHAVIASGNLRPSYLYKILSFDIICRLQSFLIRKIGKNDYITPDMLNRLYKEVIKNSRIPDGLDKVEVPCLLIAGEKEQKFIKESNKDLNKILAYSEAILIKGSGHSYPWRDSSTFNNIVLDWLSNRQITNERVINVSRNLPR